MSGWLERHPLILGALIVALTAALFLPGLLFPTP